MPRTRKVNSRLLALLAEAGWTGEALARSVNALGAESGLSLHYDRTAVAHWLAGTRPRRPVPDLMAEVLSRRLGRPITVAETGLDEPGEPGDAGSWWEIDPVARLVELARGDGRRALLAGWGYSLAALSVPSWANAAAAAPARRLTPGPGRIGRAEVSSIASMLTVFSDTDASSGGGYARPALAGYLRTAIVPWLRADTSPSMRRELLSTAARMAYLCGNMCFDDELHGAAQRYFTASLRLAAEAADVVGYVIGLRALSVQACVLGHRQPAVRLAETAVAEAPANTPAEVRAFLSGQLAAANAAVGDRRAALAHLADAEHHLERVNATGTPVPAYRRASLAFSQAVVAARLGDRRTAIRALATSIRHRPARERRSRAITLARLAELQWTDGRLDQACATWQQFLDDYVHLKSGRADTAFANLRASVRAQSHIPAARALYTRALTIAVHPPMSAPSGSGWWLEMS